MIMRECDYTFTGEHLYGRRKKQIQAADGRSYHPTVKESWTEYIACVCGHTMPPSMMPEFIASEMESKRISRLHFGGETWQQGALL